ncbi:MAG: glutamine--fructose-6-phosphate transaminase (isomerizing) [Dehalococcoidia bacterium]|nr:glutamine--fructose-6-phosphate transaminase (isomerizing) [Dehalococcoidia bacterium]
MCGLIGYIGNEQAASILLGAMARLEYRGYDSAGVATVDNGNVHVAKDKGKLADVIRECDIKTLPGQVGIGHVRWATHGGVTRENAHPHCDEKASIAVVHNGIIENYTEIRSRLSRKYRFVSETDTEVIPHLIRDFIDAGNTFEDAFFKATRELKGSYAILAVSATEPDKVLAARKESPLVIGLDHGSSFIGSDVLSFLPHTNRVLYLDDGERAVLTRDSVKIYDEHHNELGKKPTSVNWEWKQGSKGDYNHFMIKEIEEQPQVIRQALIQDNRLLMKMAIDILRARQVVFVACGTSRYAALIGRYAFSKIGRTFSDVIIASEFGYFSESVDKGTLVIAISQSGETADVLDGVRQAKANGATVFSIVNVVGSSLARMSDQVLYLNCGPEIGVAATKSFMAQLILLYLLSFSMDNSLSEGKEKLREISALVEADLHYHSLYIPAMAAKLKDKKDFYYLARGINFAMAGEGALKLKEISYVHAEGMPAGELKHGTLALIESGTPVVAICPTDYTYADTVANVMEAKARGAYIIGVSNVNEPIFNEYVRLSKVEEVLYPIVTTIPLQLLAYHSAVARGLDPDKPRNLAKSVTVK